MRNLLVAVLVAATSLCFGQAFKGTSPSGGSTTDNTKVAKAGDTMTGPLLANAGISATTVTASVGMFSPSFAALPGQGNGLTIVSNDGVGGGDGTAPGGDIPIAAGIGGGASKGGDITLTAGTSGVGVGNRTTGSALNIAAGPGDSSGSGNGGSASLIGGNGFSTGSGGAIAINGGLGGNAGASRGGNVNLNAGSDASGRNGRITMSVALSEKMRIDFNGRVGIGTTAPGFKFESQGDAKIEDLNSNLKISNSAGSELGFDTSKLSITSGLMQHFISGTEKFRVNSTGVVIDPAAALTVSSAAFMGVSYSTQASAGVGAVTTATCPAGKFAEYGGCDCTGITTATDILNRPNSVIAGSLPTGHSCQVQGVVGGACAAFVRCSVIQ